MLVVDTEALVELECDNIRLSEMNSGCTKPRPWPRDMTLFKRFADYPFEERRSKSTVAKAVAEVCVEDRVERIAEAVLEVKRVRRAKSWMHWPEVDPRNGRGGKRSFAAACSRVATGCQ